MTLFNIINPDVRRNAINEIMALPLNAFQIVIKELKRSNQANALYWVWIQIIADDKGFEKDDLHHEFKRHFIGELEVVGIYGEVYTKPMSSRKLRSLPSTTA